MVAYRGFEKKMVADKIPGVCRGFPKRCGANFFASELAILSLV